jgi:hypothetical protein
MLPQSDSGDIGSCRCARSSGRWSGDTGVPSTKPRGSRTCSVPICQGPNQLWVASNLHAAQREKVVKSPSIRGYSRHKTTSKKQGNTARQFIGLQPESQLPNTQAAHPWCGLQGPAPHRMAGNLASLQSVRLVRGWLNSVLQLQHCLQLELPAVADAFSSHG